MVMSEPRVTTLQSCPACGAARFAALPQPGRWVGADVFAPLRGRIGLVRCRTCGLRFVNPRPDSAALTAFYSGPAYACHDADGSASASEKSDLLLDRIEETLPAGVPRSLLDFGCGGGG